MDKVIVVGMLTSGVYANMHDMSRRVYGIDGIAPTIHTVGGGNLEPKILIPQATKDGYIEVELGGVADLSYPNSTTRRGRVQENGAICPTITAESSGLCRIEPMIWGGLQEHQYPRTDGISPSLNAAMGMGGGQTPVVAEPMIAAMRGREPRVLTPKRTEYGKAMRKAYESGEHQESRHTMQQLEPRNDGVTNTLTTVQKDNLLIEPNFRVRKLTPKECWRLMGFTDEDFEKARQALNKTFYKGRDKSSSQLYKMAGNSIVVQVLMAIFGMMRKEQQ